MKHHKAARPGARARGHRGRHASRLYEAKLAVLGGGTTFPAEVDAPAGSYVALFGPDGSSITVTVTGR